MMKTKQPVLGVFLGLTLASLGASQALAGHKANVWVYVSSSEASGSVASTRATSDSVSYIGCTVYTSWGRCFARDANNVSRSCVIYAADEALLANARAVHGDSYVYFAWDTNGHCTSLTVENSSEWAPKVN